MKAVKTRFAPSPTGYMHVGGVRTALFTYLIAKHYNGEFLLRIEDTDQKRLVPGATELIFQTLEWLGLGWDKDVKFQTDRREIYIKWAKELVAKGLAYADPFSPEETQQFRQQDQAAKKAFLYRNHRPSQPPEWKIGLPLRFKQTHLRRFDWHDEVMGDLSAGEEVLDDFVLIKQDGLPTYNFAHIIDDQEMGITHITRGQEYLPSTPNYLALYKALGIKPPKFVTIPHILAPTGGKKLSKRDGAKSITDYMNDGFLKEAVINFLAMLGWNDGTEQDIFTLEELVTKFDISRIQKSGARFDESRLLWLNGQWLRRLKTDDIYDRAVDFWPSSANGADSKYKKQVLALVQDRLKTLSDLPLMTDYFFTEPKIVLDLIINDGKLRNYKTNQLAALLEQVIAKLEVTEFNQISLQNALNDLLKETNEKPVSLFSLIRIAISYAPFSPALNETMSVLGKNIVIKRLKATYEKLHEKRPKL